MRRSAATRLAQEGRGWLEERDGLRLLHTAGDAYEAGWQHGRLLREQVVGSFEEVWRDGFLSLCRAFPPWLWYGYAQLNAGHLSDAETAELTGLADGSGLPFDDVLLMNSQGPLQLAHSYVHPHGYGGCSQFAAVGPATLDGGMLVGRNLDSIGLYRLHRHAVLRVHHPQQGQAFVTPGFAGQVLDAVAGWNDAGLYVAQNDCEAWGQSPSGLYSGALVRRMVQHAASIEEALQHLDRITWLAAGARSFLLADGQRAVLAEIRQDALQGLQESHLVTVRRLGEAGDVPHTVTATNHFLTPGQARRVRAPSGSSQTRLARLRQMMEGAWGRLDATRAREMLMDKLDLARGEPGGREAPSDCMVNWFGPRLVRLGPFPVRADLVARVSTMVSTVCDFARRQMWVAMGEPWISDGAAFRAIDVGEELARA
ncbi:MAG: C45 family autoproteolytic acyltransferase/hydrolase [Candidatus Xenobia bacterium]